MRVASVLALTLVCACSPGDVPGEAFDDEWEGEERELVDPVSCAGSPGEVCNAATGNAWTTLFRAAHDGTTVVDAAQTFIPTRSAPPAKAFLKLRLARPLSLGANPDVVVSLRPVTGGVVPTDASADLATARVAAGPLSRVRAQLVEFDFGAGAPALTAGSTYALVVRVDAPLSGAALVGVASTDADGLAGGVPMRRRGTGSAGSFIAAGSGDLSFSLTFRACADGYVGDGVTCTTVAPNAIPNLRVWYRADALALAEGASVTSWPDSSSTGMGLTPAAGAPTFRNNVVNGKPVVRFAKGGGLQTSNFVLQNGTSNFSMAIVMKAGTTQNDFANVMDNSHGSQSGPVFQQSGANLNLYNVVWWDGTTYAATGAVNVGSTAFQGHLTVKNGTSIEHLIDGVSAGSWTRSANMGQPTARLVIGGGLITERKWDGDMAEFVYFNRALDPTEQAQVKRYLSVKYGLPWN